MTDIEQLVAVAREEMARARTRDELQAAKEQHLGGSSDLMTRLRSLSQMEKEERAEAGRRLGEARAQIQQAFEDAELSFKAVSQLRGWVIRVWYRCGPEGVIPGYFSVEDEDTAKDLVAHYERCELQVTLEYRAPEQAELSL